MTQAELIAMMREAYPGVVAFGTAIPFRKALGTVLEAGTSRVMVGLREATKDQEANAARVRESADAIAKAETAQAVTEINELEAVRRAARRMAENAVREQQNLDAVQAAALDDLEEAPAPGDGSIEIDEDFLLQFDRRACEASSARAQLLFGKVLAGEIRQPGSFSLSSLQALSVIDKGAAQAMQEAMPWFNDQGWFPQPTDGLSGDPWGQIQRLVELGLVILSTRRSFTFPADGRAVVLHPDGMAVRLTGPPNRTVSYEVQALTCPGRELRTLVKRELTSQDHLLLRGCYGRPELTVETFAFSPPGSRKVESGVSSA